MSIEAMKRVVEAFDALPPDHPARYANLQINLLRTAIQQAETKTDEPVYQICKADSVSISTAWIDVQKQQYDDAALYPEYVRRVLYTHPAPGVARDAERYRWLKAYHQNSEDIGICKWVDEGWSGQWVLEHDPDTYIDAAMLAAQAQKGD